MYDMGSTDEDFGGTTPFGAMIECDDCGAKFRTVERLSALHSPDDCRETQLWSSLRQEEERRGCAALAASRRVLRLRPGTDAERSAR